MKKRMLSLYMSLAMFALTACQQTPEEDVVVNKRDSALQEIIAETNHESKSETESNVENFKDSFKCTNENVTFDVDAQVVQYADAFPVLQAVPHEITGEEMKRWADVLFHGEPAWEPATEYSKSELEETILSLKKASDMDRIIEEYGDTDYAYMLHDSLMEEIAVYEQMYASAPDVVEKKPSDWQFHSDEYYNKDSVLYNTLYADSSDVEKMKKTKSFMAVTDDLGGYYYVLDAWSRMEGDYKQNVIWFDRRESEWNDKAANQNVDMEPENIDEVIQIATEKLKLLGISGWKLSSQNAWVDDDGIDHYQLEYTPVYQNVKMLNIGNLGDVTSDSYAANYSYASLLVSFQNNEIRYIEYNSPLDVTEVKNENVKTLTFDEIYGYFKNQMEQKYTISSFIDFGPDDEGNHEVEIKVHTIEEGMFRIKEKDTDYNFLMIPTWAFTGEVFVDGDSWGDQILCYANAIDGSIIDPALGY